MVAPRLSRWLSKIFLGRSRSSFFFSGPASTDITGRNCSPYAAHWAYDTYALSRVAGDAIVKNGGKTWFFVRADYAFGHALEHDTAVAVKAEGGKVVGSVYAPLNTSDFSLFLLQAKASKADIIGLANAAEDRPEIRGALHVYHRYQRNWS
jgi:ABC-type branched-subunit amino acid transport system substrate-binding protein